MRDTGKFYDYVWLWHEFGELCKILKYPAGGAAILYAFWTACTAPDDMLARFAMAGAVFVFGQAMLTAGIKLSERMKDQVIHKWNRIMFGPDC